MVLEVLSGRRAVDNSRPVEECILPSWALYREAREILDLVFHGNISEYSLDMCCNIAKSSLIADLAIPLAELENVKDSFGFGTRGIEAAKGLCYIHGEKALIHRNIKSNNVLIFNGGSTAKITDLHICNPCSCNYPPIRGERPPCKLYHPPEYSKDGDSQGGDVYSFGMVLLELLTGKKPLDPTLPEGMNLVSWATPQLTYDEGIQMVMDDRVGKDYPLVAVKKDGCSCYSCLANESILRPTMNEVLIDLEEALHETQNYAGILSNEQGSEQLLN
ncbi:PTI1-like tyrosine-protein kinase 1 [Salvia hispanica]|uniref:PTI1-like tyrosine-protein kinase 1 n=1 Tax=Salvia hispanica TaxID=49212 RepID=UPI0020094ED0|nr:PTI1-like tyrosine-protein kinase 1 [Salvia hispanica]